MNTLEKLEKWRHASKARSVNIDIDDGYGATCWTVTLREGKNETVVCGFWADYDENLPHAYGKLAKEDDYRDWPTLEQTIIEALRRAECPA